MNKVLDTSPEALEVQYRCWAAMSPAERYARMANFSQSLLDISRRMIDQNFGHLDDEGRYRLYLASQYGDELANKVVQYRNAIK